MLSERIATNPTQWHLLTQQVSDLDQWLLASPIYHLSTPVALSAMGEVIEAIVNNNDGLTLTISDDGRYYTAHTRPAILSRCFEVIPVSEHTDEAHHQALAQIRASFGQLSSPVLFIAFTTNNASISRFCFLIHHTVADRQSMILLTNELFHRLAQLKHDRPRHPEITRSSFIRHLQQNFSLCSQPRSPHSQASKPMMAGLNQETETRAVSFRFHSPDYELKLAISLGLGLEETLMSVLAMAYYDTFGQPEFEFELVCSGRRQQQQQEIVGWLSQTCQLSLIAQADLNATAQVNRQEIDKAMLLDPRQMPASAPANRVLNIIDRGKNQFDYQGLVAEVPTPTGLPNFGDQSQRIYALGIGVILSASSLTIQLDYAKQNKTALQIIPFLHRIQQNMATELASIVTPCSETPSD
ncbi:hypothetical protein [Vibrio lentus]|uniref:hypothetical protein n=1 Tax=Vibrio lentus TaxID=136468 RepID=UPI00178CED87|nr:hypothetical protein [Vibrio lentus]MDN3632857.1 hypothetical protein [Vibrio lentus]